MYMYLGVFVDALCDVEQGCMLLSPRLDNSESVPPSNTTVKAYSVKS